MQLFTKSEHVVVLKYDANSQKMKIRCMLSQLDLPVELVDDFQTTFSSTEENALGVENMNRVVCRSMNYRVDEDVGRSLVSYPIVRQCVHGRKSLFSYSG